MSAELRLKKDAAYLFITMGRGSISEYLLATLKRIDGFYVAGDINDEPVRVFKTKKKFVAWCNHLLLKRLRLLKRRGIRTQ